MSTATDNSFNSSMNLYLDFGLIPLHFFFSYLGQPNLLFDLAWRPYFCDEEANLINNNNNKQIDRY